VKPLAKDSVVAAGAASGLCGEKAGLLQVDQAEDVLVTVRLKNKKKILAISQL
jgi:hypothetical protein